MTETTAKAWDIIQQNNAALAGCLGPHDLERVEKTEPPRIGQTYKCTRCGGILRGDQAHWYLAGLSHGTGKVQAVR